MICQECGDNPAKLHFTKIINGEKTEIHICEECAKEKGDFFAGSGNGFSIHNLLSGLLDFEPASPNAVGSQTQAQPLRCDRCGLTYSQFRQLGRFGCNECYSKFSERLEPVLKRVHGNTEHVGKIPKRVGGLVKFRRQLDHLRRDLQRAIEKEEFEQAARLRDQIRELEKMKEENA